MVADIHTNFRHHIIIHLGCAIPRDTTIIDCIILHYFEMSQIPQLIQETLYFYECKIRIKRLHEEYKKVVSYNDREVMLCERNAIILTDRYYRRYIIWNFTACLHGGNIELISCTISKSHNCSISKYHNFTSGMTNRAGYNNNFAKPFHLTPTNFANYPSGSKNPNGYYNN